MSRRGGRDFARAARDFYPTPAEAVAPLLPHLPPRTLFYEPCAGDGALIRALEAAGHRCLLALDLEPQGPAIARGDALDQRALPEEAPVITNPPFARAMLDPLLAHWLRGHAGIWLLLPDRRASADWFAPFMARCDRRVAIGRVRWIPGTRSKGNDDFSWFRFLRAKHAGPSLFFTRGEPADGQH